jgi:hypothetical protein
MEEDEDWLLLWILVQYRSPYVQSKAVFALWRTKASGKSINHILGLRRKAREVDWFRSGLWTVAGDAWLTQTGNGYLDMINVLALSIVVSFRSSRRTQVVNIPSVQQQKIHCYREAAVVRSGVLLQVAAHKVCPETQPCCVSLAQDVL